MDDGVVSADTVQGAIQLAQEVRKLCTKGGIRLHKFVSNYSAVLNFRTSY